MKKLKHFLFGKHDYEMIAEGDEPSGGQLFGGAYHWSRYECTICHEISSSATESI